MPMPVRICWSEKDCSSFRDMGAEVVLRSPRRMMAPARRKDRRLVIMKERSTPAPATPASVCVESGTVLQSAMVGIVVDTARNANFCEYSKTEQERK
jgi:hypothetical protein